MTGVIEPSTKALGALNEMQQRFVVAYAADPMRTATAAAIEAGYGSAHAESDRKKQHSVASHSASLLLKNKKVLAAVHECSLNLLAEANLKATAALLALLDNPNHKSHAWAIGQVIDRVGVIPSIVHKQEINVNDTRTSDPEKIERIKQLAIAMGMDPAALLGRAGVIETTAVDVTPGVPALPAPLQPEEVLKPEPASPFLPPYKPPPKIGGEDDLSDLLA